MLILALSTAASAQTRKEKVLIYNISITYEKSIFVDERRKSADEQFEHFTFIIPRTITQNLNASGKIEAVKLDGELPIKDIGSDAFYDEMTKIGERHGARYILGGRATVRGRKLSLELALVNIRTRDFIAIIKDSFETGAELKTTISDISTNIEQKLGVYQNESREGRKQREQRDRRVRDRQEQIGPSPFLKAYRALDGLSFGVKTGRFFIKGPFSKVYEDSTYFSPYLSYGILKWFGLTAEADYLAADNGNIIIKQRSSMQLWGMSLNADFSYLFFEHFGVRLSAGFGASTGKITMSNSDNPLIGIVPVKKSTDPYLNIAASFNLQFKPVEIHVGGGYKSAFFKGKPLSMITIFFGFGFHL
jgi:hypothetical protein